MVIKHKLILQQVDIFWCHMNPVSKLLYFSGWKFTPPTEKPSRYPDSKKFM